jgi:sodium/proline symporter
MLNPAIIGTFALYLFGMFVIGYMAYKRTNKMSDYILGGRQLGPWTTALSAGASDMSGWLLLGLPGYAYASGLVSFWLALGLWLGTFLNWQITAKPLREASVKYDALTIPGYFQARFQDPTPLLRCLCAIIILVFFLFYTSSGLVAGGKLFESVFGLDYQWAVIFGTLAIVSYTFFGGFLAVSWTDLVQGLMMAAALVFVPVYVFMTPSTHSSDIALPALSLVNDWGTNEPLTLIGWASLMAWGLGYFGQPHILARFKAIRSTEELTQAKWIAVSWTGLTLLCAMAVGIAGKLFFSTPIADSEKVFIDLVQALFHPVVAGLLLAAILAAVMSTADSQLLVSSSALADDLLTALSPKPVSDKTKVFAGRMTVMVLAAIACTIALSPDSGVLSLVSYAWAGFGAAFGPAILISLYWKGMTRLGAFAGILVGGLTVVLFKQLTGGIYDLYEILPGALFASVAILFVSLMWPESKKLNT